VHIISYYKVSFLQQDELKRIAGEKALEYVESGMTLGLGTGSTVEYTIKKLAELLKAGKLKDIKAIPTSHQTKKLAVQLEIPLVELDDETIIDLTIDGADEIDSNFVLIKGGGGALTREKIIAYHSKREIIVADESKVVKKLGSDFALPVEILKYSWKATKKSIEELSCSATLREIMGNPYITDNGNYLLDCDFEKIDNAEELEAKLNMIPGVVECGLFIGLVNDVIIGSKQGVITEQVSEDGFLSVASN